MAKTAGLLALVAFAGTAFAPGWGAALAQARQAAAPVEGPVEGDAGNIVVTARRDAERLIEVPISISAITAEELERRNITDLRGITYATPGLLMRETGAGRLSSPVIRGMTQSNRAGADGSVSTFIDGVYIANNYAIDLALINLERVEVVRGPQSALYGRNAFAGAINYVTAQPGDRLAARVTVTGGSYDRYGVNASVSGPVIDGVLAIGLAGLYDRFEGSRRDRVNRIRFGDYAKRGLQLTGLLTPAAVLRIPFTLAYSDNRFGSIPTAVLRNCGTGFAIPAAAPASVRAFAGPTYFCGTAPDSDRVTLEQHASPASVDIAGNRPRVFSASVRPSLDLPFGSLDLIAALNRVSIYSYNTVDNTRDGTPVLLTPSNTYAFVSRFGGIRTRDRDESVELRFSTPKGTWVRAQLGGFFYTLRRRGRNIFGFQCDQVPPGQTSSALGFAFWCTPDGRPVDSALTFSTVRQRSLFGSLQVEPAAAIRLRGEARYTSEYKSQDQTVAALPTQAPTGFISDTFNFWDYKLTAQYLLDDGSNLYASVGTGHRAGGFNANASNPVDRPFAPEKNLTYELGAKLALLDRRLNLEVAAYRVDWTAIQLQSLATPPALRPGELVTKNFGKAKVKGFEVLLNARPVPTLQLTLGVAYADPRFRTDFAYDTANAAQCLAISSCAARVGFLDQATRRVSFAAIGPTRAVALDGQRVFEASRWLVNASVDQTFDLAGGRGLTARLDYRYEAPRFGTIINVNRIPARHVLNARAALRLDRLDIAVWANNALNDKTPISFGNSNLPLGNFAPLNAIYGEKATVGATVGVRFR